MLWAQYDSGTGQIYATNNVRVDDTVLASLSRAQAEVPDGTDASVWRFDVTQNPPVLVPVTGA